ncbi:MAG: polyphosphate kinase 2 family protein [Planctomycetota bacterium]
MEGLDEPISREEYAARKPGWERELFDIVRRVKNGKVPVILVCEGAQGSGMHRAIFELTEKMDPRVYTVRHTMPAREHESTRPWMWRFWMMTPARGDFAIFDESWYLHVLGERASGAVKKKEVRARYDEILSFERQLVADGTVLIKLFFQIDEKTARKRLEKAEKAGATHLKRRRKNLKRFPQWREAADEMLERTSTDRAPWHVIPAKEPRFARSRTFEIVIESLRRALDERKIPLPAAVPAAAKPAEVSR